MRPVELLRVACLVTGLALGAGCSKLFGIDAIEFAGDAGVTDAPAGDAPLAEPRLVFGTTNTTSYDFGSITLGNTSFALELQLTNLGTSATGPLALERAGDAAHFVISNDTCTGSALGPGTSCTLRVAFAPSATSAAQPRSATLTFGDGHASATAMVKGTGLTPGALVISPTLDFLTVPIGTTSTTKYVTLTNTGGTSLTVVTLGLAGAASADFRIEPAVSSCMAGKVLGPGQTCTAGLTFRPHVGGTATAVVQATTDASGNSTSTGALGGTGSMTLSLQLTGATIGGVVTSSDGQIQCGAVPAPSCSGTFTTSTVQLVASVGTNPAFLRSWGAGVFGEAGCAPGNFTCAVAATAAMKTLAPEFATFPRVNIAVRTGGVPAISGPVQVWDPGQLVAYGSPCTAGACSVQVPIPPGQASVDVVLDPGGIVYNNQPLAAWGGACGGQNRNDAPSELCTLRLTGDVSVVAEYPANAMDQVVTVVPEASNPAASTSGASISMVGATSMMTCGAGNLCSLHGAGLVTLTGSSAPTLCPTFVGWRGGGCAATSTTCAVGAQQITVVNYKFVNNGTCP